MNFRAFIDLASNWRSRGPPDPHADWPARAPLIRPNWSLPLYDSCPQPTIVPSVHELYARPRCGTGDRTPRLALPCFPAPRVTRRVSSRARGPRRTATRCYMPPPSGTAAGSRVPLPQQPRLMCEVGIGGSLLQSLQPHQGGGNVRCQAAPPPSRRCPLRVALRPPAGARRVQGPRGHSLPGARLVEVFAPLVALVPPPWRPPMPPSARASRYAAAETSLAL